jgi:hypothetical protein
MPRASIRLIDNPSPTPSRWPCTGTPSCTKGSKIDASCDDGMPTPVSCTRISTSDASVGQRTDSSVMRPPCVENLMALVTTLSRICCSFSGSAWTSSASSPAAAGRTVIVMPFAAASGSSSVTTSSSAGATG